MSELREPVMLSTDAVTAGQLYLVNTAANGTFVVVKSAVTGAVSDLKTATGATIVRQCDMRGRATGAYVDKGGVGGRGLFD